MHNRRRPGTGRAFGAGTVTMKVELFYSPGCSACEARNAELRAEANQVVEGLEWHEVNVLDNVDYAVELGVMTLPSVVIDGELVFTSMPTAVQLRKALVERSKGRG